jgi:hypothetical protein
MVFVGWTMGISFLAIAVIKTKVAREMVFQPLDMTSSTLSHPVDATLRRRTIVPHDENGMAHDRPMHPTALAEGGLLTTPSDLGRLAIELMRATQGQSNRRKPFSR